MHHLNFKGAITNFSQDHLDYHKNMKSYLNAKLILEKFLKKSIIITDKEIKQFPLIKKIVEKIFKLLDISKEFKILKTDS